MKLKQISIAIENSPGRLFEITNALGKAGVDIKALNLVDTGDFGTVRILVSDVVATRRILMQMHMPARVDEVIVVELADKPNSLAEFLEYFLVHKVNVVHMYAIIGSLSGKAIMLFHFNDNDKAVDILQQKGIKMLSAEDLGINEKNN